MDVFNLHARIGLDISDFAKNLKEAKDMISKGWGDIPKPEIPEPSPEPLNKFLDNIRKILDTGIGDIIKNIGSKISGLVSSILSGLKNLPSSIGNLFKSIGSKALAGIKSIPSGFKNLSKNVFGHMKEMTSNVILKFAEIGYKAVDAVKSIPSTFTSIIKSIPGKIKSGITSVKDLLVSGSETAVHNAGEFLKELPHKAAEALKSTAEKIKSGFETIAKVGTIALGATTTAVTALTKSSLDSYASYEQLVGGVETLFKSSADKVQSYADTSYKTAGMSANEYMETVTGFSASLLQGLGGDTDKAADIANQAILDMSDNANKMGTDMESIKNAYQGFAKQNYTIN